VKNRYQRAFAAVLVTCGLMLGIAAAATLGAAYPNLIAIG